MSDLAKQIDALSPEQRALFHLRLKKRNPSLLRRQPIPRRQTQGPCPLSFEQERLWFVQELFPEGGAYNISTDVHFSGRLDFVALQRSLEEIVRRHEILRTAFQVYDHRPMQVVGSAVPPDLPVVDLSGLPAAGRRDELGHWLVARARQPFVLAAGRPVRLTLFQKAPEEYVLLASIHHIATDWWSSQIFQKELASLYADFSQGRPSSLPELPIQFADFALWQREWLPAEVREHGLLDYWKQQLEGVPESFEIPGDRPRRAMSRFLGRRQQFTVPADLAGRLRALGRREEASPFVVFLAAFAVLLYRWTQEEDVLVGTPVADRGRLETESLIGYFLNMLILRFRPQGDRTFRDLLQRVRGVVHGAYAHQDLPFGMLLDELKPARHLNRMPFSQVAFVYVVVPETTEEPRPEEAGAAKAARDVFDPATSRVDLTLIVEDMPQGPLCFFEYSSELYDAATILHLSGHLEALLQAVTADPSLSVSGVPLLAEPERSALLFEWNDSAADSGTGLVHELFRAQAMRTPDAVAVVAGEERLTYRELEGRVHRLALDLIGRGIGPESRVAVALERSVNLPTALFGVLAAGGAFVPLDPDFPRARFQRILEEAEVSLLLTEASVLEDGLTDLTGTLPIVLLDAFVAPADPLMDGDGSSPLASGLPDRLAYILFTSGSTGHPKGIQISQAALANFLRAARDRLGFTAGDRMLAVAALTFDISLLEILLPPLCGGCVELASREEAGDGTLLAARLARSGATFLQATPVVWQMLLDAGWPGDSGLHALCGGEAWSEALADALGRRVGELWNLYGPTEATIWATASRVEARRSGRLSIGGPFAGARVHLLDPEMQLVPVGASGEVYIGGAGLARAYVARPDLTGERFVPDPFAPWREPGARLYRTGDLARRHAGGEIEFLGRLDHQVKVRGVRIELGEIETVLTGHPRVGQAVVAVHGEGPARRLVAYFVPLEPESGAAPRADELRRFVGETLPRPMVPSAFIQLAALPLTSSRKVDRRALPEPDAQRPDLESAYRAPGSELERLVAALWRDVLGVERVGVDDNFFDLGGSSLHLVKLRQLLREEPGRDLPLNVFFLYPTVAAFAEYLSRGDAVSAPGEGTVRAEVRRDSQAQRARSSELRRAARGKR
jgi:amino acid adenylation domain-containing protein